MNGPPGPPRKQARAQLAERRRAANAAARRRERMVRAGLVALVLLAVAAVAVTVIVRDRREQRAAARAPVPAGVSGVGGGVAYGSASAPVLDVWEDFQCPACRDFEARTGPTLKRLADEGKVRLVFHPLSFLDGALGNDSSRRAAAASGCAADQDAFLAYHDAVYANQPAREGEGFTDAQLLDLGRRAGLSGARYETFARCVADGTYTGWVRQVADSGQANEITQTPTVRLDGRTLPLESLSPEGISAAVAAAG